MSGWILDGKQMHIKEELREDFNMQFNMPSLLSGPERFALGGERSGPFCMLSVSHVLQHYNSCSVHTCMWCLLISYVAGRQQNGTCSPACMYKSSLTSSFICKQELRLQLIMHANDD
jgi:hypothetical protein